MSSKNIQGFDRKRVNNLELALWESNNGLLTSWLLGLVAEEMLSSIISAESKRQPWSSLNLITL